MEQTCSECGESGVCTDKLSFPVCLSCIESPWDLIESLHSSKENYKKEVDWYKENHPSAYMVHESSKKRAALLRESIIELDTLADAVKQAKERLILL